MTIDASTPTTSEVGGSPSPSKSPPKPILQMSTSLHNDRAVKVLLHGYMKTMEEKMSQLDPEEYKRLHASEERKALQDLGYKVDLAGYSTAYRELKEMIRGHFDLYSKINQEVNRSVFSSWSMEAVTRSKSTDSKGYKTFRNLVLLCVGVVSIVSFASVGSLVVDVLRSLFFWSEVALFGLGVPFILLVGVTFVYCEWVHFNGKQSDLADSLGPYFRRNTEK